MSEIEIQDQIRAWLARDGRVILWRNNTGFASKEKVRYGLAKGSADLIGLVIGTGQFLAIEVKTATGRVEEDQKAWLNLVNQSGGIAFVARSPAEALDLLSKALSP